MRSPADQFSLDQPQSNGAAIQQHIGHLIRRAQQVHSRLWTSEVSVEVTSPQFLLLDVLSNAPDIDQRSATEAASLDRSTGAELIARLASRGLIERHRDERDRRRFLVQLSPHGAELVEQLWPAVLRLNDKMTELVPHEQRETFFTGMKSLVRAGESTAPPANE